MGYKFTVGEIALITKDAPYIASDYDVDKLVGVIGLECEIKQFPQDWHDGFGLRYFVRASNGKELFVAQTALRKRPDPQPFTTWFNQTILTDVVGEPLEQTMQKVQSNLEKLANG